MAERGASASGLWIIGGFVLLIAMCRGGEDDHRKQDITPVTTAATSPLLVQTPVAEPAEPMYVATSSLNQRSAPNGAVVDKSAGGDSVHVYERRNGWARITPTCSPERWVSSKLLCSGLGCYTPKPKPRTNYQPGRSNYSDSNCPCSGNRVCIGPRGGRYCITSGGRKRYGV